MAYAPPVPRLALSSIRWRTATRGARLRALLLVRAPEAALQGMRQLAAYRLRTGLALSGIVVGVAAVVGSEALLDGVDRQVKATWEMLGGTQVGILRGRGTVWKGGRSIRLPKIHPVTEEDRRALTESIGEIEETTPTQGRPVSLAIARNRIDDFYVFGTGANYLKIRPFPIAAGRFFTGADQAASARVVVMSEPLARNLFDRVDVIGEEVLVDGQRFVVIGLLRAPNKDWKFCCMPFESMVHLLGGNPSGASTWIRVRSGANYSALQPRFLELLMKRHPGSTPDNFFTRSIGEIQARSTGPIRAQGRILITVALLCVLAGGVGIMNVFLISVTERTREIGLRIALGASRRAVLGQFLFEAFLLCAIGGAIGLAGSFGIAELFASIVRKSVTDGGLENLRIAIGMKGISHALALVAVTAGIFGSYPAWRASRLDPATSLRHE